ncbi:MAG: tryptophan halogenase family protein [Pseudomonadota bacterium]
MAQVKRVVIVGGGTAGWMAAAALSRLLGEHLEIRLVESEAIGTVGVGEATIPQITLFNRLLELDEDDFVRRTQATFKLGIEFVNWTRRGHRYFHPFGSFGADMEGVPFHHFWLHGQQNGYPHALAEFCLQDVAARQRRFMRPDTSQRNSPLAFIAYAFQFDAGLYASYLRSYAENLGVRRIEGRVVDVVLRDDGFVDSVQLENGPAIEGDLFIDCSGFRGLLIEEALGSGYDDWSAWLPCNRAVAVPCEQVGPPSPYTRSTAHGAGWQWRIPLQHRVGNGHVYCDEFTTQDEATQLLLDNLEGPALRDPIHLRFTTGIRQKIWNRNVVALGLAAGFMEPLESTSIHLIQTGIARLMTLFPTGNFDPADIDEYNRATRVEYEFVRDFLVLHYRQTERDDTPFWRHCRDLPLTDHLARKYALYEANGRIIRDKEELFTETSWLAVMHGQGLRPAGHHPVVAALGSAEVIARLDQMRDIIAACAAQMPRQEDFIQQHCKAEAL